MTPLSSQSFFGHHDHRDVYLKDPYSTWNGCAWRSEWFVIKYCGACGDVSQIDINRPHRSTWTMDNWYRVDSHAHRSRSRSRLLPMNLYFSSTSLHPTIPYWEATYPPIYLVSSTTSDGSRVSYLIGVVHKHLVPWRTCGPPRCVPYWCVNAQRLIAPF